MKYRYPSFRSACLAVVRIFQPETNTDQVRKELNALNRGGHFDFHYYRENLPHVLDVMQEDGQIEYVGGVWKTVEKKLEAVA